jgi:outer membrane protein TolC
MTRRRRRSALLAACGLLAGCTGGLPDEGRPVSDPFRPESTRVARYPIRRAQQGGQTARPLPTATPVVPHAPETTVARAPEPPVAPTVEIETVSLVVDTASTDAATEAPFVPAIGDEYVELPLGPEVHDLDLGTALSLVGGRTPQVAIAHERVQEAYADWRAAEVLWLPSIGAGMSYNKHDGTLQNAAGNVFDVDRSSLQAGLGAGAVGAGTVPRPGLVAQFHTADAYFQPLVAERAAAAQRYAATAALNDQLLAAALAYVELLEAEQTAAVARETVVNSEELVRVTTAFADSGEGNEADADRAKTELSLRRNALARAEEAAAVASARLAEVLSLDAAVRLRPLETSLVPIDLVFCGGDVRDLVARGLTQRPELHETSALVGEAVRRLQRERTAPLVPSLLLGTSYSGFGGGQGGRIDNFQDRVDVDALVTWEVRNLGFGERAARERAQASVRRTRAERVRAMDRVAREIAEAHAQVVARGSQIAIAEEGIRTAEDSYRRNVERITQGQGLPIEVLQAIQALDAARRDYVRSLADHNEAQFRLHRALGWPIGA